MKAHVEHRVPLSRAAVEVLEQARTLDDGSGIAFPSPRRKGKSLSDMAMTKLLRDVKLAERAAWVRRQQRFFAQYLPKTPARRFVAGETHRYLGRQYRLIAERLTRRGRGNTQPPSSASEQLIPNANVDFHIHLAFRA